ncbi:MAG TPA: protein kinase [Polyangiaceae bacterium]
MVAVARGGESLVVSDGPSTPYRLLTWTLAGLTAASLAVLLATTGNATRLDWNSGLVLFGLSGTTLLCWGWTNTASRFDRHAGVLVLARSGLIRRPRERSLPLAMVAALVDRRSTVERAIELVLSDGSLITIARGRGSRAAALDRVAHELSKLLRKPVHLARGALIADRFEVDRLVEQGGMGVVYRAIDRLSGQPVAVKLISTPGPDVERAERFAREARILAELDSPRIVRYVGHGSSWDGQAFLAMQWLEGEALSATLARGPLTLPDALDVLRGAAEAIAAVHARGIVHRDLKPSNLLLRGGRASDTVLLDFGIARRLEAQTRLTRSKAIIGTPHYMSPEQASGTREISRASDVFSLGSIFYECVTGRHPFDAAQAAGVLARILFDEPDSAASLRPGLPEPWSALLARLLTKDPNSRPADGRALLEELDRLPAIGDGALTETLIDVRVPLRDQSDQVLVCVVLASTPEGPSSESDSGEELERFESLRTSLRRFGCPLERLADGSLIATVLPGPSAKDQVRIAASCALYMREALPESRIAIATGRASLGGAPGVGDAVDRAAQLLDGAEDARAVRLDTVSAGLLDERFSTVTRGEELWLIGVRPELDETRRLLGKPTPCVGRDVELAQLETLVSAAVEEGESRAAVLLGPPGTGKSRLRHELVRRARDRFASASILIGYGDPLSAGSPYVLIADALRRHAGIRLADDPAHARRRLAEELCRSVDPAQTARLSEFLGELCGVPFPAEDSPPLQAARGDHRLMNEQVALAFCDWLAAERAVRPVVIVLEDMQWGDALTVKLLEAALRDLSRGPLFVLTLGRPETDVIFPKLFAAEHALSMSLRGLGEKACEQLARGALGDRVDEAALRRIVRLAAGNALFLEELIRAAAADQAMDVPETVLAMLQARLSALAPAARRVLRAASLLGETFWRGGVQRIVENWGASERLDHELAGLVELELVTRLRSSRYPDDSEYTFRHALVCDAAYGLLTDADRRAGHLVAGRWLESKGEADAAVLARHAELGGDRERAVTFYRRSAEQSLDQYDFAEALARANKGIDNGAEGQTLGVLKGVQCAAYYSMGTWTQAADIGLAALPLLNRGGGWWCSTVERLFQVLPNVAKFEESSALSEELLRIEPEPGARAAYLRAVYVQLLGHSIAGEHAKGRRCLEFIARVGGDVIEQDVVARGYAGLWRAVFLFILGDDPYSALRLAERCVADLEAGQVMYRLSLAHVIQSFIWWGLGDNTLSEACARKGRKIAEQSRDHYHSALAHWYLGLTLTDELDPAKLEDAERCARAMVELQVSPIFEATSYSLSARVALGRSDWATAESDARKARASLAGMPPFQLIASASLLQALGGLGRHAEAASIARADLDALNASGEPLCSEVLFRVAAAEAFYRAGEREPAVSTLRAALDAIDVRRRKIPDVALQNTYLTGRRENRRAFELSRSWLEIAHQG